MPCYKGNVVNQHFSSRTQSGTTQSSWLSVVRLQLNQQDTTLHYETLWWCFAIVIHYNDGQQSNM